MSLFKRITTSKIDPTDVKDKTADFLSEAGNRLGGGVIRAAQLQHEQEQQAKRLAVQKAIAAAHDATNRANNRDTNATSRANNRDSNATNRANNQNNNATSLSLGRMGEDGANSRQSSRLSQQMDLAGKRHTWGVEAANKKHVWNMAEANIKATRAAAKQSAKEQKLAEAEAKQAQQQEDAYKTAKLGNEFALAYGNATTPQERNLIATSLDGAMKGLPSPNKTVLLGASTGMYNERTRDANNIKSAKAKVDGDAAASLADTADDAYKTKIGIVTNAINKGRNPKKDLDLFDSIMSTVRK